MNMSALQRPFALTAAIALFRRELIRFLREPSRVAASIGTPVLLWIFVASGLSGSMLPVSDSTAAGYGAYLLPGMVTMVILFSTIFASISLIQDRQAGFLQSVLVSPAPTWTIVASKVLGGALIATTQAAIMLASAPIIGLHPGVLGFSLALLGAILTAIALVGMGLALAWRINSNAGFHGVMNSLLMPMWLLSGALFPVEGASPWLAWLVTLNPLHWCTICIARSLGIQTGEISTVVAWVGAAAFAAVMFISAAIIMGRTRLHFGGEAI